MQINMKFQLFSKKEYIASLLTSKLIHLFIALNP